MPDHKIKARRRIGAALSALTANLLAATAAHAQTSDTGSDAPVSLDTGTDIGTGMLRVESAILFYQEAGSRVRAVEPVFNATLDATDGEVLSFGYTADTLTGATPNGAAPWSASQTFSTPTRGPSSTTTVTGASGNASFVTIPGGAVVRQYTTPANRLPSDQFRDQRHAFNLGYSTPWGTDTRFSFGGAYSKERDFTAYSVSGGVSQDLNGHNTRLALTLDFEGDQSQPAFGTPTPLTVMSGLQKGPAKSRTETDVGIGVTQAINRYWVAQLNYNYGSISGYQTDPYRIISLVNGATGAPVQYLYESRPNQRTRQSLYFANKIALGPTFADVSARLYRDNWGITSTTIAVSDRIPFFENFYVEPGGRWYHQTKANFFDNYLVSGAALPRYASSDSRLDAFNASTTSLQIGYEMAGHSSEVYLRYEDYKQNGNAHPTGSIAGLANQNLFTGTDSTSVMVGVSLALY